ncbi:11522_t:CDS:2 [Ambispora gerdemannii]|uniref:11522_t:CDS:1 n=1 Tax=Ambispora gerdemannii TaxID=144530 RepID=A0A9N9CS63_9GLOM|nr:11522_t:CDS:2 [Ambispora gerdemannii]
MLVLLPLLIRVAAAIDDGDNDDKDVDVESVEEEVEVTGVVLLTCVICRDDENAAIMTYITYVAYLFYQVATDNPTIELSAERMTKIEVPDIEICGYGSDLRITKCAFTFTDWTSINLVNCSNEGFLYVYPSSLNNPKNINYCYLFTGNKTLWFTSKNATSKDKKIFQIEFYFKILNFTGAEALSISVPTIAVQILDPDSNILWKKKTKSKMANGMAEEITLQENNFAGIANYSTSVRFRRNTYREILDSDFASRIGFKPNYENITILTSTAQYFPLHLNPNFTESTESGHFCVRPGSYLNRVQSEKRVRTLLGVLGLAGGAFSAVCTILILLFGDRKFRPLGIVHRVARSEVDEIVATNDLPLITSFAKNQFLPDPERIVRCENRIQELEALLTNYFFDVTPLTYLRDKGLRRKSSENVESVESAGSDLSDYTRPATSSTNMTSNIAKDNDNY